MRSLFDYPDGQSAGGDEFVFLTHWSDEDWRILADYTETRRFRAREVLVRTGEPDRSLYILLSGRLEAVVGEGVRARRTPIGEGALFGEIAFFDGRPRSADVRALTEGEVLRLGVEQFSALAARHPDVARDVLFDLGRLLASRLRRAEAVWSA